MAVETRNLELVKLIYEKSNISLKTNYRKKAHLEGIPLNIIYFKATSSLVHLGKYKFFTSFKVKGLTTVSENIVQPINAFYEEALRKTNGWVKKINERN